MPRYFFFVQDGSEPRAPIGAEMAGLREARREAMQIARSYAASPEMDESDGGQVVVGVRDEVGAHVLTVRLVFSVEVE